MKAEQERLRERLSGERWQVAWHLADSTLSVFLFFPSMVFYWRGIWDLFGVYVAPSANPPERQWWIVTGFGACSIVGYFAAPLLSHLLSVTRSKAVRVIATRVYLYSFGVLAMAYWRGVWGVADAYLLGLGWPVCVAGLCISHGFLLAFRCSRTTILTPFLVNVDTRKEVLSVSTCFRSQTRILSVELRSLARNLIRFKMCTMVNWREVSSVVRYSLDSLFTHFFILTMTIISWRSSLSLLDALVYPHDWLLSNLVCGGVGLTLSIALLALETTLSRVGVYVESNCNWLRLIYEDLVYVITFAAVSLIWRGAWNLNVIYVISDPMVGGWVNLGIGSFLLLSLQLMSFAGCCGCAFDGRDRSPADAFYPVKYLRVYFRPKQQQQQQVTSDVTPTISSREMEATEEGILTVSTGTNNDVINEVDVTSSSFNNENRSNGLEEET